MHKDFPNWYNAISLRHDVKILQLRWEAVEALVEQLRVGDAPKLVRVFFSLAGAEQFLDQIRKVAQEKDVTFVTDGDRNELTVLAGAAIAQTVAKSSNAADAVALSVSCACAQGLRQNPRLQDVVDDTTRYLADESVRIRQVNSDLVTDMNATVLNGLISTKGGIAISDFNNTWGAVEVVLKGFLAEHTKHTKSINLAFSTALSVERERSEILWWLFGEHTRDGKKAFSNLTIPEACFWGARDLADLTHFLPGPFAAPSFLHRMLRLVKAKVPAEVKLSESVNACSLEWKQKWVASLSVQDLPDFCPMLFAVTKSVEVGGETTWTSAFEHATGLMADAKLPPIHLAQQIYNEALLLRALAVKN
jgi:hypothetical protein